MKKYNYAGARRLLAAACLLLSGAISHRAFAAGGAVQSIKNNSTLIYAGVAVAAVLILTGFFRRGRADPLAVPVELPGDETAADVPPEDDVLLPGGEPDGDGDILLPGGDVMGGDALLAGDISQDGAAGGPSA